MAASKPSKFNMMEGLSIAKQQTEEPAKKAEPKKNNTTPKIEKEVKEEKPVEKKAAEETPTETKMEEKAEAKEKKGQVRDGSTVLSLVLTPDMKAFIKFESNRRKIKMSDYIGLLLQQDYEKDKDLFEEYKSFMEKFSN